MIVAWAVGDSGGDFCLDELLHATSSTPTLQIKGGSRSCRFPIMNGIVKQRWNSLMPACLSAGSGHHRELDGRRPSG